MKIFIEDKYSSEKSKFITFDFLQESTGNKSRRDELVLLSSYYISLYDSSIISILYINI